MSGQIQYTVLTTHDQEENRNTEGERERGVPTTIVKRKCRRRRKERELCEGEEAIEEDKVAELKYIKRVSTRT